jgi:hypothetical protein
MNQAAQFFVEKSHTWNCDLIARCADDVIASILLNDLEMHLSIFYWGRLDFATEVQREFANYLVTDEPSRSRAQMIPDKPETKLLRHGME